VDISLGGFRVTLHDEPKVGEVIICSIDILNKVFEGCSMTVARVEENDGDPPSWTTGMSIKIPDNLRAEFEATLKMAFPDAERGGSWSNASASSGGGTQTRVSSPGPAILSHSQKPPRCKFVK
jgi:hypothetical protein